MLTFGAAMNLLLSVCALLLTLGALKMAFRIHRRWNRSDDEERHDLEKGFYLTFSVVMVVLGIRLFLVPLYFWNMQSFVPFIPGAMCLWGVFNALPQVAWPSLFLKIVLPAAYLSWLLIARINTACRTNPLIRNLMALFILLVPVLLIDFGTEIYVLSQISPVEVSCCSSAIDVGTRLVPSMIGNLSGQTLLLLILFPYGILYVASLILSVEHRAARFNALAITFPIGIVFVITVTETLTPWLLRLPFHHCPFCLFFQHPLALVFTVLFWFGLAAPWLTSLTRRLGRPNDEARAVELRLSKTITTYAAFAMTIAMALILVDILMVFS